jgi:molybdate transport system substrate-binding protein
MREIGSAFGAAHPGTQVRLNVGASGALLQQIARGAPVDVFASADAETMDQAQQRGLIDAATRSDLARNALVLIVPAGAATAPRALADLAGPAYRRIAIGLPASVPAGRYAWAALDKARLRNAVEPKAIATQSVRQALDYVARGEVDAGFVYATDARLLGDRVRVAFEVALEAPVRYPIAALAASPHPLEARQFVAWTLSATGRAILARHGFAPP